MEDTKSKELQPEDTDQGFLKKSMPRREFFGRATKYALYVPPTAYLLMHKQKEAVAGSGATFTTAGSDTGFW